jgi:hypothetical protein
VYLAFKASAEIFAIDKSLSAELEYLQLNIKLQENVINKINISEFLFARPHIK